MVSPMQILTKKWFIEVCLHWRNFPSRTVLTEKWGEGFSSRAQTTNTILTVVVSTLCPKRQALELNSRHKNFHPNIFIIAVKGLKSTCVNQMPLEIQTLPCKRNDDIMPNAESRAMGGTQQLYPLQAVWRKFRQVGSGSAWPNKRKLQHRSKGVDSCYTKGQQDS